MGTRLGVDFEVHGAVTRIPERVSDDLRNRRRQTGLLQRVELEETRDLGCALTRGDDVLIVMQVENEQ